MYLSKQKTVPIIIPYRQGYVKEYLSRPDTNNTTYNHTTWKTMYFVRKYTKQDYSLSYRTSKLRNA